MRPGGHLATAIGLGAVAYASTRSVEAAAGCFAGGFLIDVDHYFDYLVFEKQWRRPSPVSFLRYYFECSPGKLVLPLHSAELMGVLLLMMLVHPHPLLIGYWTGALMHLTFDVLVNGEHVLKRPVAFYAFSFRYAHQFQASALLEIATPAPAQYSAFREFFHWRPFSRHRGAAARKMGRHACGSS